MAIDTLAILTDGLLTEPATVVHDVVADVQGSSYIDAELDMIAIDATATTELGLSADISTTQIDAEISSTSIDVDIILE